MTVAEFIEAYVREEDFDRHMKQLEQVWSRNISHPAAIVALTDKFKFSRSQLEAAAEIILEQIEY